MKTFRTIAAWGTSLLLAVSMLATNVAFAQDDAKAGDAFLHLLDTQQYAQSWDDASQYLKQSVSRNDWVTQMAKARGTLGALGVRTLVEAKPEKNPNGAPPGDYLLMTYKTVFASQGEPYTETVPLIKAPDGTWRAMGYFVHSGAPK